MDANDKHELNTISEENVFIDKRKIKITQNEEARLVDALHIGWANNCSYLMYFPPPVPQDFLNGEEDGEYKSDMELWTDTATFYLKDLKTLLALPYHKFWSQIVHHKGVHDSLGSYLQHAPRSFTVGFEKQISEEAKHLRSQIHRFVFLVYLRMSTHKEAKDSKITPAVFGNLIYDNFVFDIPKIIDLCAIYGLSNKDLLKKMVENIFENQKCYFNDLKIAVEYMTKALTTIEEQFGLKHSDNKPNNSKKKNVERIDQLSSRSLQDVISYTLDTFGTIYSFLDIYSQACDIFLNIGFPIKLASLYDSLVINVIPELRRRIGECDTDMESKLYEFNVSRTFMLKTFQLIIATCYVQPTLEKSSSDIFDSFLTVISSILSERRFIVDYDAFHPWQDDLDLFSQVGYKSDTERIDYVTDGLQSILLESGRQLTKPVQSNVSQPLNQQMSHLNVNGDDDLLMEVGAAAAAASAPVKGVELSSLISQVKDLLPTLGDGFVKSCLEYYNYDVERVINAILEESLPSILCNLDREMALVEDVKPVPNVIEDFNPSSLIEQRRNVFDNDEFDIFRRSDIDLSRVHRGKRNKLESISSNEIKDRTLKLLEESLNPEVSNIYDDEYDDTYDEHAIDANESVTADEMLERPFELPRVLGGRSRKYSSGSSEESANEEENVVKRDEFVSNPAELREKAEQRRQEKMNGNYHHRDVRGGPKGHGQSNTVVRNRTGKEKHKSTVANHNRRAMADRKRSGGMFPR
ncbi:hypothetical protein CHUAL_013128 [Chamberlinius hualienensis]